MCIFLLHLTNAGCFLNSKSLLAAYLRLHNAQLFQNHMSAIASIFISPCALHNNHSFGLEL